MTKDEFKGKYLAFVLDDESRNLIRTHIPPEQEIVVIHHVTLEYDVTPTGLSKFMHRMPYVAVIGHVSGRQSQALMVMVDGENRRLDGNFYHVTLSHHRDSRPADSNEAIAEAIRERRVLGARLPSLRLYGMVELLDK